MRSQRVRPVFASASGVILAVIGLLFYDYSYQPAVVGQLENAPPLATCTATEIEAAQDGLSLYEPVLSEHFLRVQDQALWLDEKRFQARGINYYPSRYPWRRFLTEAEPETIDEELLLLRDAGLNTLRVFLWNEALFPCPGSGAIPNVPAFQRLDDFFDMAIRHGFYLIVTLNDLADLEDYPLYTNPLHTQQQTAFIVERYRDEAGILAWDVRNEGDIDYGSNQAFVNPFPRQQVLDWLALAIADVRALDDQHLITAGWLHDAESTAEMVDFVSFHHWSSADDLRGRIETLRSHTDKPILLEEFGYSTFRMNEDEQARNIYEGILAAEQNNLAGWLVWTAFDFPLDATCIRPACPSLDNAEHHFGLWQTDYIPKPAAGILIDLFGSVE